MGLFDGKPPDKPGAAAALSHNTQGPGVQWSEDLDRIVALPRRQPVIEGSAMSNAMIDYAMARFARESGPCDCAVYAPGRPCVKQFLHVQAWALHEMAMANGLVLACPVGGGKCCRADTEVFDYSQGRRRRLDEEGTLAVASFSGHLEVSDATAFPSGEKPCVRVCLRDGTELELSTDHPVLTQRGWVEAAQLRDNDFAAVAVQMPEPDKTTECSDDLVKFLAYMLGDGACSQVTMSFTNMTPAVIDDFSASAEACGYSLSEQSSKSRARQFNLRNGRQPEVQEIRERWGLYGLSKDKRVHPDIWGLPKHQIELFINRFWACDGHVSARGLECILASEKLIDDLRFLLSRLGIRSRKHYKKAGYTKAGTRHEFDAWRLSLRGEDALKFLQHVGDVLGKEAACQTLRRKLEGSKRNTNTDVVPVGYAEVREILQELNILRRRHIYKKYGVTHGQYLSRQMFCRMVKDLQYTGKYSHLATSDVAWERVERVEHTGLHPVYDLNVPGNHNFVANGVVIHNTLIGLLAARAIPNCKIALMLIPSSLVDQIETVVKTLNNHFALPNVMVHRSDGTTSKPSRPDPDLPYLHILPYTKLSATSASQWIDNLRPDLIIADECDALADPYSARTLRVARHFLRHIDTRFVAMTGSITDNSIGEMRHLSLWALRDRTPMPMDKAVGDEWAASLDAVPRPAPAGDLVRLCADGERARQGFRRRLAETEGFIMVEGETIVHTQDGERASMRIISRDPGTVPDKIREALKLVEDWQRPDTLGGAEYNIDIADPMERARTAREVASGMFYKVVFPRKEPHELRERWYLARKNYFSDVRWEMRKGNVHMDSPKLLEAAAMRGWGDLPDDPRLPSWRPDSWPEWRDVRSLVKPGQAAVRLDSYLIDDVARWASEGSPGIIWYQMREFAAWLHEKHGIPLFEGGMGEELMRERGDRSIAVSINAHGRGRDGLQYNFGRQCIAQFPSSSRRVQQLFGRLLRRNTKWASIDTSIYRHLKPLRDAYDQAVRRAEYVEEVTGETQMILSAIRGQ